MCWQPKPESLRNRGPHPQLEPADEGHSAQTSSIGAQIARRKICLHLRSLTIGRAVLQAPLTAGYTLPVWNRGTRLCLRRFRPAQSSESVSTATLLAKGKTVQDGDSDFRRI